MLLMSQELLPTSEQLNLVTINVDSLGSQAAQTGACPVKIKDVNDLVQEYPEQFDKIGNLQGKAKLLLKDGATPFIDAPHRCSIHIKDKLKKS